VRSGEIQRGCCTVLGRRPIRSKRRAQRLLDELAGAQDSRPCPPICRRPWEGPGPMPRFEVALGPATSADRVPLLVRRGAAAAALLFNQRWRPRPAALRPPFKRWAALALDSCAAAALGAPHTGAWSGPTRQRGDVFRRQFSNTIALNFFALRLFRAVWNAHDMEYNGPRDVRAFEVVSRSLPRLSIFPAIPNSGGRPDEHDRAGGEFSRRTQFTLCPLTFRPRKGAPRARSAAHRAGGRVVRGAIGDALAGSSGHVSRNTESASGETVSRQRPSS